MAKKPTYEELERRVQELETDNMQLEKKLHQAELFSSDLGELELADIIDVPAVQFLMEKFYRITGMLSAIVDSNGKVLVEVGWQDICTQFHRCHPETHKNCVESDLFLSSAGEPGEFTSYRCKNGLWDVSTPIVVSGLHMGNIYFGQFVYSDEALDVEQFRNQARRCGFDEAEYLAALHRVPRYDRETVEAVMAFYSRLGVMISALSFSNIKLSRTLTEQKRMEEALREREEKYRLLFNMGVNAMFLVDNNTTQILECNNKASQLFGYSSQELLSMKMTDLSTTPEVTRRACQENVTKNERVYQQKNGGLISVDITSEHFHLANRAVHISAIRDITDKKLAEKALWEKTKLLQNIIDTTSDFVAVTDMEGNFKFIGPSHRFLGYDPDSLVGRNVMELVHPDDYQETATAFAEFLANREDGRKVEYRYRRADGDYLWFETVGKFILDDAGNPKEILFSSRDSTERKQAEAKILYLQKAESLGRMAGSIAHHFNNHLSVVMGNLELVLIDLPDDAENRDNLFQAFEAGRKAAEVSQQMLRYLGHISGSKTTINLSDVCRQSLTLLQSALPNGVSLNVDFPDFGPFVHADAGQIQQVLTTLFTNAQESLPDNQGIIGLFIQTVSHEDIPTPRRFPLDWQPQNIFYACLEISDTGCGISKKDIEKIFEPFYTTKFTGRGMGLPITMGILKTHGGCITVDNKTGFGCVFQVYLPVMTEKKSVH